MTFYKHKTEVRFFLFIVEIPFTLSPYIYSCNIIRYFMYVFIFDHKLNQKNYHINSERCRRDNTSCIQTIKLVISLGEGVIQMKNMVKGQ